MLLLQQISSRIQYVAALTRGKAGADNCVGPSTIWLSPESQHFPRNCEYIRFKLETSLQHQ